MNVDIFIHIPKTAGTTLRHLLSRHYTMHELIFVYPSDAKGFVTPAQFQSMSQSRKRKTKLIFGHMLYGAHHDVMSRPSRYITMLREPTDRVVSEYHHHLHVADSPHHRFINGKRIVTLEDFVDLEILPLDNVMVRMIANLSPRQTPYGQCSVNDLNLAKYRLRNVFGLILITERFTDSMWLLSKFLGANLGNGDRLNVNAQRPDIGDVEPRVVRKIQEINYLDVELYKFARTLFERQSAASA